MNENQFGSTRRNLQITKEYEFRKLQSNNNSNDDDDDSCDEQMNVTSHLNLSLPKKHPIPCKQRFPAMTPQKSSISSGKQYLFQKMTQNDESDGSEVKSHQIQKLLNQNARLEAENKILRAELEAAKESQRNAERIAARLAQLEAANGERDARAAAVERRLAEVEKLLPSAAKLAALEELDVKKLAERFYAEMREKQRSDDEMLHRIANTFQQQLENKAREVPSQTACLYKLLLNGVTKLSPALLCMKLNLKTPEMAQQIGQNVTIHWSNNKVTHITQVQQLIHTIHVLRTDVVNEVKYFGLYFEIDSLSSKNGVSVGGESITADIWRSILDMYVELAYKHIACQIWVNVPNGGEKGPRNFIVCRNATTGALNVKIGNECVEAFGQREDDIYDLFCVISDPTEQADLKLALETIGRKKLRILAINNQIQQKIRTIKLAYPEQLIAIQINNIYIPELASCEKLHTLSYQKKTDVTEDVIRKFATKAQTVRFGQTEKI